MSLTKFPLLVPHTETSISARPQTTGQCTKNIYTASMTQFPSTAILHHTSNKANTQFGLLEGMYTLHSLQKWLRTQQPRSNQQRQPSTSSIIAPPKTMWSTELSDEEDNPLARTSLALQMTSYHFFWTQIMMKTTMGMTLSHAKTKKMESLWKP